MSEINDDLMYRIDELEAENNIFRQLLFQAHGCAGKYGDDGEMQCNRHPLIDFKRNSAVDIDQRTFAHGVARWEEEKAAESAAVARVAALEAAIRNHRDQRGDNRCWLDDRELYAVIDDTQADTALPEKPEFLQSCERFWQQRQAPGEVAPECMTIAQLMGENARLITLATPKLEGIEKWFDANSEMRWCEVRQGESLRWCVRLLEIDPDNEAAGYERQCAHFEAGTFAEAMAGALAVAEGDSHAA